MGGHLFPIALCGFMAPRALKEELPQTIEAIIGEPLWPIVSRWWPNRSTWVSYPATLQALTWPRFRSHGCSASQSRLSAASCSEQLGRIPLDVSARHVAPARSHWRSALGSRVAASDPQLLQALPNVGRGLLGGADDLPAASDTALNLGNGSSYIALHLVEDDCHLLGTIDGVLLLFGHCLGLGHAPRQGVWQ